MDKINLKGLRKTHGYTQTKLAKLIGIPQQQYSRYETNTNKIPLETFLKMLEVCNLEMELKTKRKLK